MTADQRAELWAFHLQVQEVIAAAPGAERYIAVPFRLLNGHYCTIGWPALYAAGVCQIAPSFQEFDCGEPGATLLPVFELPESLMGVAGPRLLNAGSPRLLFLDGERPQVLDHDTIFAPKDEPASNGLQA